MSEAVRTFNVKPNQYTLFRFSVPDQTTLHIKLMASDPVNLLLLDNKDKREYEEGIPRHTYTASWGRRSQLDTAVDVDAGTWYLVVEGGSYNSRGRVEVFQE
jgi:hypothetical protein